MKVSLSTLLLLFVTGLLPAQQIPNSGFDSVYIGGIDRMFEWITADGVAMYAGEINDTIQPLNPDSSYLGPGFIFSEMLFSVNVAYMQPFINTSIQLQSLPRRKKEDGSTFPTFIISGEHLATDQDGYPDFFRSGYAFPHRPDSLKGYYQFTDSLSAIDNWGKVLLFLTRYHPQSQTRDTIAYLNSSLDLNPTNQWTAFSLPIPYQSQEQPDSLALSFFPSVDPDVFGVLLLDELQFVYASTNSQQPMTQEDVQVFPNPVKDVLRIRTKGIIVEEYELWDIYGRLVKAGHPEADIDLSDLDSGVYVLKIKGMGSKIMSKKIVKY